MRRFLCSGLLASCLCVGCGNSSPSLATIQNGPQSAPIAGPRFLRIDDGADGKVDLEIEVVYDSDGKEQQRRYDFGDDGTIELTVSQDDEDRSQEEREDRDNDGNPDSFQEAGQEVFGLDEDADGDLDLTYRNLEDTEGRELGRDYDTDADGVVDRTVRFTY
jgi:major membrane immunogen (membrane-anchored lipoprotein)